MKRKQISFENKKFVKIKNAKKSFVCALCKAPREMRYSKNLEDKNYLQIIVLSAFLTWCLFPLMEFNAAFVVFIVWPVFEMVNKSLYRKEIPCPYCGFDATWYRRDVKMARKKVSEFWEKNPFEDNASGQKLPTAPEQIDQHNAHNS